MYVTCSVLCSVFTIPLGTRKKGKSHNLHITIKLLECRKFQPSGDLNIVVYVLFILLGLYMYNNIIISYV